MFEFRSLPGCCKTDNRSIWQPEINNAAYQMAQERIEDLTEDQFRRTFETNMFGYFFMVKAALPHLKAGDAIVNTGSIGGIVGNPILVDYTATKGPVHSFTKSLAIQSGK